jgi:hypothetical protein
LKYVLAFSDVGTVVYDCFTGSGTSIAAAHVLGRVGYKGEHHRGLCAPEAPCQQYKAYDLPNGTCLPRSSSSVRLNRLAFVESSSRPRPISGAHEARYTNTTKEARQHDQDQYAGRGSMNRNAKAVLKGAQPAPRDERISKVMAQRIEHWKLAALTPYPKNPRSHSDAQVAQIAGSILAFGFNAPVLVDAKGGILAGHGRYLASLKLGLDTVPVVVLDHLSEAEKRAYILADNKLAELSSFDDDLLRAELTELKDAEIDLGGLGFSEDELRVLLADADGPDAAEAEEESIPEAPTEPVTRAGDLWRIAGHRMICGDCRDRGVVSRLFDGAHAHLVITSPPYATQREYDASSGFTPIPPENYSDWYSAVAANVAAVLAPDGSYFLNIKAHADDGERNLYVMDLVLAHKRQWGWRFVDEFCWRKTDNGVPGGWGNRFKNAFEPVFHFCRQLQIKFHPTAVGHLRVFSEQPDVRIRQWSAGYGRTRFGRRAAQRRRQRWPLHRLGAPLERNRSEIGIQPRLAFRTVPASAGGVFRAGIQ